MSELLKRMILNGDGVGWLPQYSIQRELDEGRLTILDESLSLPIGARLYRSGSRLNGPPNVSGSTLKPVTNRGNNPSAADPQICLTHLRVVEQRLAATAQADLAVHHHVGAVRQVEGMAGILLHQKQRHPRAVSSRRI